VALKQAGGLPEIRHKPVADGARQREALRATPPVMNKKRMHPGEMPESHGARLWHPSGMYFSSAIISDGVAHKASLNLSYLFQTSA
jgi:hypothetical protein